MLSEPLRKRFDDNSEMRAGARMTAELLEDKKRWDQFVEASPQGFLFHKWDFLKTVERHSKYQFLPYCIYLGEQPICVFPFFVGRDRLGITQMLSPAPLYVGMQIWYLGPVFHPSVQALKATTRQKMLDHVTGEVRGEIDRIAPNYVSFTTVPNFLDVRSFIWKNYREQLRFTSVIDLERSLDEIWMSFTRRCRQGIKYVSTQSPEIQQTDDVSALLDIWRTRFPALEMEVPLLSDGYLKDLVATFPHDVTVYNLVIDGRLATATACCTIQKERYGYWIGNVNVRKDLSVTDYLIWEVIKRAKSDGFKKLDLGESDERLSKYKAKFDPVLEPFCFVERVDALGKMVHFAFKSKESWTKRLKRLRS
jgi:hypothetical protein